MKVYKAVVLPFLLYACETWTPYSRHAKKLNAFHMRCLRSLLRIKWQDKVPDTEVLQRAEMESTHALLLRSQLRWAGHVLRMDDNCLPKRLLYGELTVGKRPLGRPKKRYKDTLKEALKKCDIPHSTWEQRAQNRVEWRSLVKQGVTHYEEQRILDKQQRRMRRKVRLVLQSSTSSPAPNIPCPHCNRFFRARIGLISHLRTHPIPK